MTTRKGQSESRSNSSLLWIISFNAFRFQIFLTGDSKFDGNKGGNVMIASKFAEKNIAGKNGTETNMEM